MNKSLLVLGHMGLGDHLLTNGMMRFFAKNYEVNILSKKIYNDTLNYMFSDIKEKVKILSMQDDSAAIKYFIDYNKFYDETLKFGNFGEKFMVNCKTFDESFYIQAKVPYEYRWTFFKAPIEKSIDPPKNKYIFLHEDRSRNFILNKKYIDDTVDAYIPSNKENFFSYFEILKNSHEIHCMDSSFAAYIDHIEILKEKPKYLHRYVRKNTHNPYYRNNWKIINE